MRYFWVIRHAKSADGGADHERPLNKRGCTDGTMMQSWYATQNHQAEWVWTSSALRAQQTAAYVGQGFNAELCVEPNLYLSSPDTLLDCLRTTPDHIQCAAIVAHNPGLTHLVNLLSVDSVTDNLVTLGSALFATEQDWHNLSFGTNHFLHLHTPKTVNSQVS